jgi:hypothetical protein
VTSLKRWLLVVNSRFEKESLSPHWHLAKSAGVATLVAVDNKSDSILR